MPGPIIREYDKRVWKKCIKCRGWHPRKDIMDDDDNLIRKRGFGEHSDSSDGLQAICFFCKNDMNNKARNMNVTARVRHHTGTRCLTQLGKEHTPRNFVANLEDYLGYKITTLVKSLGKDLKEREGPKRKLRDALNDGYHIDHIKPLSTFKVLNGTTVDWDVFRECWALSNLRAIPADENLAKGAKYDVSEHSKEIGDQSADSATSSDGETQEEQKADEKGATQVNISASTEPD